ncbi:MAG: hypothetical protein A3E88_01300 [Legionellales bacterium RIFCSPHIGHO2_12_FULL_35_11]|nr:MAG: hypothetical protein A3E88_01300 [Legionellales bacterium RIFCSPHIGHO2_12_FULL_35_11]
MSEKAKPRLIGALVLVSMSVIFLPAIMKQSNRNFEKNIKLALKLPANPRLPNVSPPTNAALFKQAKVVSAAKINITKVQNNSLIAKAMPLQRPVQKDQVVIASHSERMAILPQNKTNSTLNNQLEAASLKNAEEQVLVGAKLASNIQASSSVVQNSGNKQPNIINEFGNAGKAYEILANTKRDEVKLSENIVKSVAVAKAKVQKDKLAMAKIIYSIQVATFIKKKNADLLLARLKSKGYVASYNKIIKNQDTLYQVVVGRLSERNKALDLQKNLASNMQLNGFIVKRLFG